ncbi:hypothetical protein [Nocardia sp. SC052]|uniref:hypothetical protein n=1 Tax=Nocardia sichangensis TaxID=3385975 RepID=UPI0039A0BCBD
MTTNTALMVTFTTAEGKADAFAELLERARPLIEAEAGTTVWLLKAQVDSRPYCFRRLGTFRVAGQSAKDGSRTDCSHFRTHESMVKQAVSRVVSA